MHTKVRTITNKHTNTYTRTPFQPLSSQGGDVVVVQEDLYFGMVWERRRKGNEYGLTR
jgi:hypothetical protein